MRYCLIFLFLLARNISLADEKDFSSLIGKKAPAWELEDQFGRKSSSKNYSGKNTIYILSDRSGNEFVKNWTSELSKYKEKVSLVNVADLSSAPGFLKGFLKGIFRDKIPYPLLLDWDGELAQFYGYPSDVPMLIAVDREGEICLAKAGKGAGEEVRRFCEEAAKIFAIDFPNSP